jgi:hypothetical protein
VSDEDSAVEPLGEGEASQESVARYRATDDTAGDSDTAAATAEGVGLSSDGANSGSDASNASNAEGGE